MDSKKEKKTHQGLISEIKKVLEDGTLVNYKTFTKEELDDFLRRLNKPNWKGI